METTNPNTVVTDEDATELANSMLDYLQERGQLEKLMQELKQDREALLNDTVQRIKVDSAYFQVACTATNKHELLKKSSTPLEGQNYSCQAEIAIRTASPETIEIVLNRQDDKWSDLDGNLIREAIPKVSEGLQRLLTAHLIKRELLGEN